MLEAYKAVCIANWNLFLETLPLFIAMIIFFATWALVDDLRAYMKRRKGGRK